MCSHFSQWVRILVPVAAPSKLCAYIEHKQSLVFKNVNPQLFIFVVFQANTYSDHISPF